MLGWKFSGAITKHSETKHQWNLWLLSNRKCDFELLLVNSYMKTVRSFYSNFKGANELLLKYLLMAPFLPWLLCHPNNNKKWVISNWFLKWKEEVGWSRYRGYSFFIFKAIIHTIFPWINTQGAYSKFYLRGGCLLERRQLFEGGTYQSPVLIPLKLKHEKL